MNKDNIIWQIAIDGPAGVGKSTVAKLVAQKLGFKYIDTGAMYRAITYLVIHENIPMSDSAAIYALAQKANIEFKIENDKELVFINKINVTDAIRQDPVNTMVSTLSAQSLVRKVLVAIQQQLANSFSTVMDGRDIGTVVMPNAQLKIYLEASSAVRAQRRYMQLTDKGYKADLQEIELMINQRDEQDKARLASPLKPAPNAVIIDTDNLTMTEVIEAIINELNKVKSLTLH